MKRLAGCWQRAGSSEWNSSIHQCLRSYRFPPPQLFFSLPCDGIFLLPISSELRLCCYCAAAAAVLWPGRSVFPFFLTLFLFLLLLQGVPSPLRCTPKFIPRRRFALYQKRVRRSAAKDTATLVTFVLSFPLYTVRNRSSPESMTSRANHNLPEQSGPT